MSLKQTFSSRVLQARLELHYTQAQMAEAVSISVRWYQKIEKGQCLPSFPVALRLLLFLKIDPEAFRAEAGLIQPLSLRGR